MKRFAPLVAAVPLLLFARPVSAMESTVWDFRGQVPVRVTVQHLTAAETASEGLFLRTDTDGFLEFPPLESRADTLTLTLTNVATPKAALIWSTPELGEGEYYQADITLPVGQSETVSLALNQIGDWDWKDSNLGLAFPAGSEVLLETMEWRAYTPLEKFWNGVLSFWTPDRFTLYSINFLWGPLIGTTPEARGMLFDTLPPPYWSATRILYGAFALAAALGAAYAWNKPDRRARFLTVLAAAGAALWIVFDARMAMEIGRYVADDWRTYVTRPAGQRTLRTHATLYDAIAEAKEALGDDRSYVLLVAPGTPTYANVRYALYPAVPVAPEKADASTPWIVIGRTDVKEKNGALTLDDGTVLSPAGTVTQRFDASSFFFRPRP